MNHPFFAGTKWDTLHTETPPELVPYLPSKDGSTENLWSEYKVGAITAFIHVLFY
jgi:hypothetical protein